MITKLITPVKTMGFRLIEFAKAAPRAVQYVIYVAVPFVTTAGAAQPAQASEAAPSVVKSAAGVGNIMCFFGAPDVMWLSGLQGASRDITGKALGVLILIAMICGVVGGIKVLTAGNDTGKARSGTQTVVNVGFGLVLIIGCLLVGAIVIGALFGVINFTCG